MAAMAQLRYSPIANLHQHSAKSVTKINPRFVDFTFNNSNLCFPLLRNVEMKQWNPHLHPKFHILCAAAGGGDVGGIGRGSGGGDGGGEGKGRSGGGDDSEESKPSFDGFGPIGAFVNGWRSRVAADAQFPFKVLMEELVGVTACVIGDMASRPNFGLNELDFVFSTLVVGSILNFVLMYLLAPTLASATPSLPSIFANSPTSHMFEVGAYSLMNRFGTLVYKGTLFAAVGFAAGLVGTAISNGLIMVRKKMDPEFETPNKPPPTLLNAGTWALHMGISSNLRYQTLNGVEYLLAKGLPPFVFKSSVIVLRCLNNVLGGMTFVILAKYTGSQSAEKKVSNVEEGLIEVKPVILKEGDELQVSESASK